MKTKHLATPFEIKSLEDDGTFQGYGSVFDVEDSYGDVVEHGAFKASLEAWKAKGKLPSMLWQHRADEPIGIYTKMAEDERGLYVEGRLLINDDPLAKRAYAHMKAGSISGLSIGYSIPRGGAEWDPQTETYRLKQVDLWEVSLVTFPANEAAQIDTVKSALESPRDCERILREAGFTRTQAKALMADGYKALNPRDAEESDLIKSANTLIQKLRGVQP